MSPQTRLRTGPAGQAHVPAAVSCDLGDSQVSVRLQFGATERSGKSPGVRLEGLGLDPGWAVSGRRQSLSFLTSKSEVIAPAYLAHPLWGSYESENVEGSCPDARNEEFSLKHVNVSDLRTVKTTPNRHTIEPALLGLRWMRLDCQGSLWKTRARTRTGTLRATWERGSLESWSQGRRGSLRACVEKDMWQQAGQRSA